jgi:proteasome accessory factor A
LDEFVTSENLDWTKDAQTLQSIELAYHDIHPQTSLFDGLVESGAMRVLVSEKEIENARETAPQNTRAALRGALVKRFGENIKAISWGAVLTEENGEKFRLPLPETGREYSRLAERIIAANSIDEVSQLLS